MEQELIARFDAKRDEVRGNLCKLLIDKNWFDYIDM